MVIERKHLVIAVFDHRTEAEQAVLALWKAGFANDKVDMITRSDGQVESTPSLKREKDAANGAAAGAMAGAGVGAVAGAIAIMLIPGIGTVIGGGLLMGLLGGAAMGAAGGTYLGPFVALRMEESEAHYYAHEVEQGRIVVLVHTEDRGAAARDLLRQHGGRERTDVPAAASL